MKITLKVKTKNKPLPNKESFANLERERKLEKSNITEIKNKFARRKNQIKRFHIPSNIRKIIRKFKETPVKDQILSSGFSVSLNRFISLQYAIDAKKLFGGADSGTYYADFQKQIRNLFVEIIEKKIPLDYELTEKLQETWNSFDGNGKKMQKTKVDLSNNSYLCSVVCATHIHHVLNKPSFVVERSFQRIHTFGRVSKKLSSIKQISMARFLVRLNNDLDNFLLDDDIIFKSSIYEYRCQHPEQFEKFKHLFLNHYYNREGGQRSFDIFRHGLAHFLDRRIFQITDQNVDTCGFKLLIKAQRKPAILDEYFQYLKDINCFRCVEIINDLNWNNFVNHKMRGEYDYKTFWKPKKEK